MNYQRHYDDLIKQSRNRLLEGYCEKHHIVPVCMGGANNKENIAILTAREHYVAHQLLVKIYPKNRKLVHAAILMTSNRHGGRSKNRIYGWLKSAAAENMSKLRKGKTPWNKGKAWSDEMRQKISEANKIHAHENPCSDELRAIRSKNQTGRKYSPEFGQQISERQKGKPSSKMSTCSHCNKTGRLSGMVLWHFDKCKLAPVSNSPIY